MLFAAVDKDNSGSIDMLEFFELTDALTLHFAEIDKLPAAKTRDDLSDLGRTCYDIVNHTLFRKVILAVVLLNALLLSFYTRDVVDAKGIGFIALEVIDDIFLLVYVAEISLKIGAGGWHMFWFHDVWHKIDVIVVALAFLAKVFLDVVVLSYGTDPHQQIIRIAEAVSALRVIRVISVTPWFKYITNLVFAVIPAVTHLAMVLIGIFYFFAVLGMETMAYAVDTSQMHHDFFDSFGSSMLTLFQCMTTSNWHEIMYTSTGASGAAMAIYFVLFFFLVVMIIMNLVTAAILELISLKEKERIRERKREALRVQGEGGNERVYKVKSKFSRKRELARQVSMKEEMKELKDLSSVVGVDLVKIKESKLKKESSFEIRDKVQTAEERKQMLNNLRRKSTPTGSPPRSSPGEGKRDSISSSAATSSQFPRRRGSLQASFVPMPEHKRNHLGLRKKLFKRGGVSRHVCDQCGDHIIRAHKCSVDGLGTRRLRFCSMECVADFYDLACAKLSTSPHYQTPERIRLPDSPMGRQTLGIPGGSPAPSGGSPGRTVFSGKTVASISRV
eukprot:GFYU01009518.1.p1 GENE.GFYU01009518.1~~GFYU01009518.1.p1  ORF type:complete len:597 (-),score=136.53 GFYU01009518.1:139-1815(-)